MTCSEGKEILLDDFLVMQIMGQLTVNIIYIQVKVLHSTERIKALFMKILEQDCI